MFKKPRSSGIGRGALRALGLGVVLALGLTACSSGGESSDVPENAVTVYSGRTENLIGPILEDFTKETGIPVDVRYGDSADLALLIEEEGDRSPADVFISQSPGAVGYLADKDRLGAIPKPTLNKVEAKFRNKDGLWVGMSGRVRVLNYDSNEVDPKSLPDSVFDLTGPEYKDKVAVAPANGSFQDFVTAMRQQHGDDRTQAWLNGMAENGARSYANNVAIVEAVGRGEVPLGLVNHYYNVRAKTENPDVTSENYFFPNKDIGSLLIVTAVGILDSASNSKDADALVSYLLSEAAQQFFSDETSEYPLVKGVPGPEGTPPLDSLEVDTIDLDSLGGGLGRTLEMIQESGLDGA